MLCYVMLCYVMLCYVMLCYVMLCYVTTRAHGIIVFKIIQTEVDVGYLPKRSMKLLTLV
jgi:hypothetical protein